MRPHWIGLVALAMSQVQRAHQRRNSRRDMHHGSAREIEARNFSTQRRVQQPALAPHHVRHRKIHDQRPQGGEQQHPRKFHPLGERARNQSRSDDREHQLINHEGLLRNGRRIIRIRRSTHPVQPRELPAPHERIPFAEGHAVPDREPDHRHHGHQDEAVHHGRQNVFAPDESAVKQRQPRPGHHQDQRRAHQHPRVVPRRLRRFRRRFQRRQPLFGIRGKRLSAANRTPQGR